MKKIALILSGGAMILLPQAAHAAFGKSFEYLGVTSQYQNYTDLDFAPDIDNNDFQPYDFKEEDSGTAMRFFYGRQINSAFAIESGINFYTDPDFEITSTTISEFGEETRSTLLSGSYKSFGIDFKAIGTFSINNSNFIRLQVGALFWDNDFSYVEGTLDDPIAASTSRTGVDPILGVGYGYSFNRNTAVFLDVERTVIQDVDVHTTSLSLVLKM